MITDEILREVRALAEAATKNVERTPDLLDGLHDGTGRSLLVVTATGEPCVESEHDARLWAASRSLVLSLLDEVERLRAANAKLTREGDAYRSMLAEVLASAGPTPRDHPCMFAAWERAREVQRTGVYEPPARRVAAGPVCSTCDDTHRMSIGGASVSCTRCPVPCEACRGSLTAYCTTTPCACSCHAAKAVRR
jgi:hypothetical protein